MQEYDIESLVISETILFLNQKRIKWTFVAFFIGAVVSAQYHQWGVAVFCTLSTILIMIASAVMMLKFLILGLSLDTKQNIPNIKVELNIPTQENFTKNTDEVIPN